MATTRTDGVQGHGRATLSLMRTPWLVIVLPLTLVACDEETDHTFSGGITGGPGVVHNHPDGTFVRVGSDGPVADAAADADVGADAGPDMGAVVDAATDLGPDGPTPMCVEDNECTRAVLLDTCDACPVPMTREEVGRRRCATEFVPGQAFSVYTPAGCRADCPPGTLEFCDGRIFAVRCTPEGACENIR